MFGATIWTLLSPRSIYPVNRKMFTIAFLLLLFSTTVRDLFVFMCYHQTDIGFLGYIQHFIINIIRVMQGLILFRDTYPGGPIGYFSDVSQWTFVSKNYVFAAQTLLGDGVVVSVLFPVSSGSSSSAKCAEALPLLRSLAI